jgi:drug/metabolite transporter (DMT)-like permease
VTFTQVGELAALGTAVCWAGSALSFEEGGKRIGSLSVNVLRLAFASLFLAAASWIGRGVLLPTDAGAHAWTWLAISGLVGFTFGDMCLFRAFVVLGSRLSVLIMSLVPPVTALMGWVMLGETLSALDALGMALTVTGVFVAVRERAPVTPHRPPSQTGPGVLLALGGVLGQAGGLVLSKHGMGSYNAIAATQIRVLAGLAGFVVVFFLIGWWPRVWAARKSSAGLGYTALGSFFGPVVGVSLALYAIQHTSTGVAASIMATTPILIIPLVALLHKERATSRGVTGAVMAIAGVIVLFL